MLISVFSFPPKQKREFRMFYGYLYHCSVVGNSLTDDKFFYQFSLKEFYQDRINLTEKFNFVLVKVENIVGKGENAGNQHFLLFPQCFQKASSSELLKVGIVW